MKPLKILLAIILSALFVILAYIMVFVFSVGNIQYKDSEEADARNELHFTVERTWNGIAIAAEDKINITLKGTPYSEDVAVSIQAPLFGGFPPFEAAEEPFQAPHEFEVVELFFLTAQNYYLQIQCIPNDRCRAKFYDMAGNDSRVAPSLDLETKINGTKWIGKTKVPGGYFPPKVTKFNAASEHRGVTARLHFSLYPSLANTTRDLPDLTAFRPITMSVLDPAHDDFALSLLWDLFLKRQFLFTVTTTWDRKPLRYNEYVSVTLSRAPEGVIIRVDSPFFNDTNALPAHAKESFKFVYDYEDVEVFFLNENDQYLQVELSAHGVYFVTLFKGRHQIINRDLPLNVTAYVYGTKWIAETVIPWQYFPPKVRKLNVAAQHGPTSTRKYIALSPSAGQPDFHNLYAFKRFDMKAKFKLSDEIDSATSPLWESSLKGEFVFIIAKTWDGRDIPEYEKVTLLFKGIEGDTDVSISIDAPFYDDGAPKGEAGNLFKRLSDYEVVEVFFVNTQKQYLHIVFSPHGEYMVSLLNGVRNTVKDGLPLEFSAKIEGTRWFGKAVLPWEYFPLTVVKFNAYCIHGVEDERKYHALHPADGTTSEPNLHDFKFFGPIQIDLLGTYLYYNYKYSYIWGTALDTEHMFQILTTWNGTELEKEDTAFVSVKRRENSTDFSMWIQAPIYNDTAPNYPQGQSYRGLNDFEAVDVYFTNQKHQYLQVTVSPHGNYYVVMGDGKNNEIGSDFPLSVTTFSQGSHWIAETVIPHSYFPPKVIRFGASAQHGEGENRTYISLSPTFNSVPRVLDLQNFNFFLPFNMKTKWNLSEEVDNTYSPIWNASLMGASRFVISQTWNGENIQEKERVNIEFSKIENSSDVFLKFDAPFFDDPAPNTQPGKPYYGLWNYEAIEVYFLNDKDALSIDISPRGNSYVLLLLVKDYFRVVKSSLPLNVSTSIEDLRWTANVTIPWQYFPPQVSKFNAFSMSGKKFQRQYLSLYPVDGTVIKSDFRDVEFAQATRMHAILPYNETYSPIWQSSLKRLGYPTSG